MKTQVSSRQLSRKWQALLAQRLSGWIKYGTYGLYRRTEDFVQWLVLDPSAYGWCEYGIVSLDSLVRQRNAVKTLVANAS